MDRYKKVEKSKPDVPISENEIRITSQGLVRNYITYATTLLEERSGKEIVLKAMGQAINKTVAITEILKRRNPRLHQDTAISSVSIVDVWEPIEEGLLPVETSRKVSMISITLSGKELNKNSPGYQGPPNMEQPKQQNNNQQQQQSRPQRMYQQQQQSRQQQNYPQQRPQQQPRQARSMYNVNEDSYGRGRVQGRGRGSRRGSSRGGYGNYEGNFQGNYPGNYQGSYQGNYQGNYQGDYQENGGNPNRGRGGENGGYQNRGRGGGSGGGYSYRGAGRRGRGGRGDRGGYGRNRGGVDGYAKDDGQQ